MNINSFWIFLQCVVRFKTSPEKSKKDWNLMFRMLWTSLPWNLESENNWDGLTMISSFKDNCSHHHEAEKKSGVRQRGIWTITRCKDLQNPELINVRNAYSNAAQTKRKYFSSPAIVAETFGSLAAFTFADHSEVHIELGGTNFTAICLTKVSYSCCRAYSWVVTYPQGIVILFFFELILYPASEYSE